ncbi:flagellar hook-basal body complex protein FliE [Motilibacter peucedani]|uniref:Flagellar hook-basal body complex protein FliE n=1 Tax=Motilibacter peucedani TaxID=598650 RepID=A0A420XTH7_9ACTN|nr:flagellar hook-basal body complex protein FliE [Motilibacter peucedani]RKS80136.1 flagellar hook-basal body complex protein FliE [Motilibacter peucedani]
MSIAPISFAGALGGVTKAAGAGAAGGVGAGSDSGASFGSILAQGLQSLQNAQTKQDTLAVQAATGDLTNVHDYTVAAAEAKLATSLTVALRDKAVGAFNEIMRMQA